MAMSLIEQVRVYISKAAKMVDVETLTVEDYFTDPEIEVYLLNNAQNVKRAAAEAILTLALDTALIGKDFKRDDLQILGSRPADVLRKVANDLKAQARQDEIDGLNEDSAVRRFPVNFSHRNRYGELLSKGYWR